MIKILIEKVSVMNSSRGYGRSKKSVYILRKFVDKFSE